MKLKKIIIKHLYVHVPFFSEQHFAEKEWKITNFTEKMVTNFLNSLKNEIEVIQKKYELKIETIYVGGIIVSTLLISDLIKLLQLFLPFITNIKEYSFECSFPSINLEKINLLKKFGINRLVWKVITFQESIAKGLNYDLNQKIIINLINESKKIGFTNFSIDLKYGLLNQTIADLKNDLLICQNLEAPHVSYDSLKTNNNFKKVINQFFKKSHYDNYEYYSYTIAANFRSKYILSYYNLENYYGLGPNASSFIKGQENNYIIKNSPNFNNWKSKKIILSTAEFNMQNLIQHLFLQQGLKIDAKNQEFFLKKQAIINQLINEKKLKLKNKQLFCTNQGWVLFNDLLIDIINSN